MENAEQLSLFGADFEIKIPEKSVKETIKKATKKVAAETDPEKILKSKKLALNERLAIINTNVLRILGKQKNNVLVIKDKATLDNYVSEAIKAGRIAIDTETNNSTDPATCKLMGPCLYYPGGKQAYIPINHRDPDTKERLSWQLTEEDCKEAFQKINDSRIEQIFHNGKFDYEVIKCTCGIAVKPTWDTLVGARLIDENKFRDATVGLKSIYTTQIDKTQEKYSIDHLFENVPYADVDPDIFALYAATDSMMTDKVYLWERETFFDLPENSKVKWLFDNIEMPIVPVTAEIELRGVFIDQELGERLKIKYNNQLTELDEKLSNTLNNLKPMIDAWRLTPEANEKTKQYVPAKTKMTAEKIEATYTELDKDGNRYKVGKAKTDQLPEEINMSSSTQLAILLFDILGCPTGNANSRATGEDEIKELKDKLKVIAPTTEKVQFALDICDNILTRRGLTKIITTYIDVIPDLAKHWPDGRIRYKLNSTGTDTGRFASGGKFKFLNENDEPVILNSINSQNIPSHNPEIRLLFNATTLAKLVEAEEDEPFIVDEASDVETARGWIRCKDLQLGDLLYVDGTAMPIKLINYNELAQNYLIGV